MPKYLVRFEYNVDRSGRDGLHSAHADNLYRLADDGVLLLGGPLAAENAGLLLYEVADREELQRLLDDEPYVRGGVVSRTDVSEWNPGKGHWIGALNRHSDAEAEGGR